MKNVKKIVAGAAALGVGALMITGAMAANVTPEDWTTNITRNDLFTGTNLITPNVSVVVGSQARPSDIVWAGNIAAAIGARANALADVPGGYTFNNVMVEVGTQGGTTVTGDGKLVEFDQMGTEGDYAHQRIRSVDWAGLFDDEITYKDADNKSQRLRIREEILFAPENIYFSAETDVQEIVAQIPYAIYDHTTLEDTQGLVYRVNLGAGLDEFDSTETGDRTNITIPFLGRNYKIQYFDAEAEEIKLVTSDATTIYSQGQSFNVEGHTITVGTITSSRVLLTLNYDGQQITESLSEDDSTDFGVLDEEIMIMTLEYADNQQGYVEVSMAEGTLTLTHGDEIEAFEETLSSANERKWTAYLEIDDADKLKSIAVYNDSGWDVDVEDDYQALRVGDTASLPLNFGGVTFVGLKSEPRYLFETTTERIKWSDDSDSFDIPIFQTARTSGTNPKMTVNIDGYDYYFTLHTSGDYTGEIVIRDVDDHEDDASIIDVYIFDSNYGSLVEASDLAAEYIGIPSELNSDIVHYFYVDDDFAIGTAEHFGIALSRNMEEDFTHYTLGKTGAWGFYGTLDDAGSYYDYYMGEVDVETYLAEFWFVDIVDDINITAYFDPNRTRRRLADLQGGYSTGAGKYESEIIDTAISRKAYYDTTGGFRLDNYETDDLRKGITLAGTVVEIVDNQLVIDMPEVVQKPRFFVGGAVTSTTEIIGQTFTLTTEGEVKTQAGISAKLVSKDIGAGEGGAAVVADRNWNPSNIVILDTGSPANAIIVGGWYVNRLAENLGLQDIITAEGDYVFGKAPTGQIVVAGMTAGDTGSAAQALINAILAFE